MRFKAEDTYISNVVRIHSIIVIYMISLLCDVLGPPVYTKQWMSMFCKERLVLDLHWGEMLVNAKNRKLISLSGVQINITTTLGNNVAKK